MLRRFVLAAICAVLAAPRIAYAQERSITLARATSTEQSGLLGHILPICTRESGIAVRVVALGTGQALDVWRRVDADVVVVHDRSAELRSVVERHSVARHHVMFNDFVLGGLASDPIADGSGMHAAELRLWPLASVDPAEGRGRWYREVSLGRSPALNTAAARNAHLLADRGTWLSFRNRQDLRILVEGDA